MRTILMSALWLQFSCGPAGSDFYCPSCPCENDTRKHWILHQKVQISFQNFPTHLPKVLPLLTTKLTRTKNLPKKSNRASWPSKETYLSSLLSVEFFPILSGAPQSNAALPKSSDGKTSKAWLNARRFEDHENNFLNSFRWNLVNNLFVMSTVFLFSKKWLFCCKIVCLEKKWLIE